MKWYWSWWHKRCYKQGDEMKYYKWQTWLLLPFAMVGSFFIMWAAVVVILDRLEEMSMRKWA